MEDKGKINLWSSLPWGKREEKEGERERERGQFNNASYVYKLVWLKFLSYATVPILYNTCLSE
jgi:hypothetical protein